MNAGAYGGEVSDVLFTSLCYDSESCVTYILDKASHDFSYRTSAYEKDQSRVVLSATFELGVKSFEEIKSVMDDYMSRRRDKQPLEYPSAGSTFKRPEGHFAGKLIEDAGLKGYRIGGAEVSEKHAGFVVNRGGATAADVLALIRHIKDTVAEKFGVSLECEIKYID
jgi:UDP-N-acetylmuramate dehydrogenase